MSDRSYEKPSYFSILPANVRYDNRLRANEKILYSEITALSNKYGYCTANNNYFARLYEVSTRVIKKWMADLEQYNYINSEIIRDPKTKQVMSRKIYLVNSYPGEQKFPRGGEQKFLPPGEQKFPDNNTSYINNTSINNSRDGKKKEKDELKDFRKDVISYLNSKADKKFSSDSNNAKKFISARYKDGYRLDDFKTVIDHKVISWKGQEKWDKFLRPETLFGNKFESYLNERPINNNKSDNESISQQYGW